MIVDARQRSVNFKFICEIGEQMSTVVSRMAQTDAIREQPIRPFVLSTRHPPSSNALCPGGRCPPGQRWPRAARRTVGGRCRLEGCVPRGRGLGFARATFISPRTTVTPLSYIPQPCNGANGPKGLLYNKSNKILEKNTTGWSLINRKEDVFSVIVI